jgi:hypothetical protein
MSGQLLLLTLLIPPLQLPYYFYSKSVQFLILYFGFQLPSGGAVPPLQTLFSHLHTVLNKYFPKETWCYVGTVLRCTETQFNKLNVILQSKVTPRYKNSD